MYLVFGVLTTLLNWAVYIVWTRIDGGKYANVTAVGIAWVISVLFAYFTNRRWVFESAVNGLIPRLRECGSFFGGRLLTGLLDLCIMYLTVDIMRLDGGVMKLLSNVAVIVLNYILSKLVIFRKAG